MYGQLFDTGALKEVERSPSHRELSQAGDIAYEYGVNRFMLTGPDGDALDLGKYFWVWWKIDGEWYAVALSLTSDTPAPVPVEP